MAPVRDFYQVGGFQRSGFNARYTSDELAQAIAGPHSPLRVNVKGESYVELVLGILPSGASYLLVTADQFHALTFRHHCLEPKPSQRPWSATDFMSLSPIVFHDVGELKQKIGTYKHKAGKNISGDTSQANKAYVSSGNDRTAGESRAAYEQQRLLYRTITKTVDPEKFSYPRPSVDMLRVLAITFTLQPAIFDGRKSFQRRSEPKVLDIGWAEAHLDSSQGLTFSDAEGVTGHARFKDNMIFGGPGKNAIFEHGTTVSLGRDEISTALRAALFLAGPSQIRPPKTLLLTHDAEITRAVLCSFNIDINAQEMEFNELMTGNDRGGYSIKEEEYEANIDRSRDGPSSRAPHISRHRSSRSRSPGYRSSNSSYPSRPRSPKGGPRAPYDASAGQLKFHITDILAHSANILPSTTREPSVSYTAHRLGVRAEPKEQWCAGNDARLLIEVWKDIASGVSIDERKNQRLAALAPSSAPSTSKLAKDDPSEEADPEFDPKTFDPNSTAFSSTAQPGDPYAEDDDDDDDDDEDY